MFLPARQRLKKLLQREAPNKGHFQALVPWPELQGALRRERARVDRRGGSLLLMLVELRTKNLGAEQAVLTYLDKRIREYDLMSVMRIGSIVTLFPDCSRADLQGLVESMDSHLADAGVAVRISLFSYPEADGPQGPHGSTDKFIIEDLAPFFQKPVGLTRRCVDIAASGSALLLLSPVLAAAAVAVKLTSPGPVFYIQSRAGLGGEPFPFIKLRSMYIDADERQKDLHGRNQHSSGPIFKMKDDPRITPVGRFLRKYSLDELPQLWNVLCGDMTLIGPRPPRIEEVEKYEPWQRRRLDVKGGLTCIWQVSGRSDVGFLDWVRMDLQYVNRRHLGMELSILRRTFAAVISGRGAY